MRKKVHPSVGVKFLVVLMVVLANAPLPSLAAADSPPPESAPFVPGPPDPDQVLEDFRQCYMWNNPTRCPRPPAPPTGPPTVDCSAVPYLDIEPGDIVLDKAIGVEVPSPGKAVFGHASLDVGSEQLEVEAFQGGNVRVSFCGSETGEGPQDTAEEEPWDPSATDPGGSEIKESSNPGAKAPCQDDAKNPASYVWKESLNWYFKVASRPSGLGDADVRIRQAASAIENGHNDCGMPDQISATHYLVDNTSASANINGSATQKSAVCMAGDQLNVVDFGNLDIGEEDWLGVSCTTHMPDSSGPRKAVETDIRLNKADYRWTLGPCPGWSVRAVAAHEWLHAFGLNHVAEDAHGNLTASPRINGPCQEAEYTLGKGDMLGLNNKY